MVVVVVDENNRNMVVVVGKVQQKCVGGGCGGKKKTIDMWGWLIEGKWIKEKMRGRGEVGSGSCLTSVVTF